MLVVRGKVTEEMSGAALEERMRPYAGVTVDLGAGDGRFAYRYAAAHPDRLVIAVDPVRENLREMSARAARKPERGGGANALFVVASIEQAPPELRGVADEIYVTLPWGSLMRGLILGQDAIMAAIASMGRDGAALRIVLNTRIFDDPVPIEVRDLPEVTPDYVRDPLIEAYARHRIDIREARWMYADEVAAIGTTWGKRLSHRAPPRSVLIEATVGAGADEHGGGGVMGL
ncbi:MAG: class I SAM-dependent methyltransferase [Chloroflexota bacterium]|nr:class I SAM-dependent methyltransferase [Chloroflexota bacterium]